MKIRIALTLLATLLLVSAGSTALAQDYVEENQGIIASINGSILVIKGYEYHVTASTEVLNEYGLDATLNEFEPMETDENGLPDRETGSKVYFEADYDHNLKVLKKLKELES